MGTPYYFALTDELGLELETFRQLEKDVTTRELNRCLSSGDTSKKRSVCEQFAPANWNCFSKIFYATIKKPSEAYSRRSSFRGEMEAFGMRDPRKK